MNILLIGIGGLFGGITRFHLGKIISQRAVTTFPIATLIINISGALLLGIVSGLSLTDNAYLMLGEGFLGAYTTFSTFMYEGFHLFQEKEKLNAFIYILGSLIIGILGYAAGFEIGKLF